MTSVTADRCTVHLAKFSKSGVTTHLTHDVSQECAPVGVGLYASVFEERNTANF